MIKLVGNISFRQDHDHDEGTTNMFKLRSDD